MPCCTCECQPAFVLSSSSMTQFSGETAVVQLKQIHKKPTSHSTNAQKKQQPSGQSDRGHNPLAIVTKHLRQRLRWNLSPLLCTAASWEPGLRFHPERGWYRNSRPKMGARKRSRAWDCIDALTLKQMVSKGTQSCTQVLCLKHLQELTPFKSSLPTHKKTTHLFNTGLFRKVSVCRKDRWWISKTLAQLTTDGRIRIQLLFPSEKKKIQRDDKIFLWPDCWSLGG